MKRNKRLCHYAMTMIALLAFITGAFAQQTVSGTLRAPNGDPLVGATVQVRGTKRTVTTDANGHYSIQAPAGSVLLISYVGFSSQEVPVTDGGPVSITMQPTGQDLQQVVVIGYQTIRRRDLTGATGVVDMANASKVTASSVGEAIQGLVAGVTVRNSGAPGQNSTIEIRGVGNFGNSNPLYVIDGMLADANSTINPDDVASIQVLKDASAAAIYGSRAGNGVIIITTKKGRNGPPRVTFSAKYGSQQVPKKWNVMDAAQFLKTVQTQYQNSNATLPTGIAAQIAGNTINTNWQDQVYRTGNTQDYNVGISGGTENSSYLVSTSYYKNKGVLVANDFERASLRINTEARKGRFSIGENMVISNTDGHNPGGGINPFYDAPLMLPIIGVQGSQYSGILNNPGGWGMGTSDVPSYSSNYIAETNLDKVKFNFAKIVGNAYVDVKLLNWLSYRFNAGAEVSFDYSKEERDSGIWRYANQPPQTSISEARSTFTNFLLEHTLNFSKVYGKHNINGVVGFSRTEQRRDVTNGSKLNLTTANGTTFTTIDASAGIASASGGTPLLWRSHGYLGRINYTYNDRYLLTLTGRIDQDSRFGPSYHTGYFPSVAAGWRISHESFFNVSWISDLKLRGSYGKLGFSDVLGSWPYIAAINRSPRAVYGVSQTPYIGAYQSDLTNPDLRWETRVQKNIGFDAALFNNRLIVTMDYYNNLSSDVLVNLPTAFYLGGSGNPPVNAASIRNKGVELTATYRHATGPIQWDLTGNFTTIKNRVEGVGNMGVDAAGNKVDYIEPYNFIRAAVGHSIGEWYVIRTAGIFRNQAEIDNYKNKAGVVIQPNAKPGDIKYVDAKGDGVINDKDRQFAGSPWPTLQTGLQLNATFKSFTLNIQLIGVFGNKIYDDIRHNLDAYELTNFRKDINPWTSTNTGATDPRLAVDQPSDPTVAFNNMAQTDRWLENGSYVRLRNVEIGYILKKGWLDRINFSRARVYVSGQNLFTITKYKGLDPDVQGTGIISRGFDAGNWPSSRVISVGIQCDF